MILVISTSLNPHSKSRTLAKIAFHDLEKRGTEAVEFMDLQTLPLPQCDGGTAYQHPNTIEAIRHITRASAIIVAAPVYNFSVSSSCKNLIELTGNEWRGKPVAFITATGSSVSYMATTGIIMSLLFDFRCHIVPKIVMADATCFSKEGDLIQTEISQRISNLVEHTLILKNGLKLAQAQTK